MDEFTLGPEVQEQYLQKIREGVMRGAACDELGLVRRQMREFIAQNANFEAAIADAEIDATEHVKEALYNAAVSGSVPAAKAWLEMNGEEFAERRGRPPNPKPSAPSDPFGDLRVVPLDSRRQGA